MLRFVVLALMLAYVSALTLYPPYEIPNQIIYVSVTSILFILWYRFSYWARHGVNVTYFNLRQYTHQRHLVMMEESRRYGRIYGGYFLWKRILHINHPEVLRDVLVRDFHVFRDRKPIHPGRSLITLGLLFSAGDVWKRCRSIISPAFTPSKIKSMMAHISDVCDQFVLSLKTNEIIDIHKNIDAFAMNVLCGGVFGVNVDTLNDPEHPCIVNIRKLFRRDIPIWTALSVLSPMLAKLLKLELMDLGAVDYFHKLVNRIVSEKISTSTEENSEKKRDFIQLMIDSQNINENSLQSQPNGNGVEWRSSQTMTTEELTAQGLTFFMAGFDSTVAAITHAIYYLSQNSECQQRLYDELKSITDFSYEVLNELQYLNAVISETLRLAPSVIQNSRLCSRDYKLCDTGIIVPKGTVIMYSPYCIHRDADFWPEPEKFKPQRFIEGTYHPYSYLPFGTGPRNCVAQRFTMNELRMCLAKLIYALEFSIAPDFTLEYYAGLPILSLKELLVTCRPRQFK